MHEVLIYLLIYGAGMCSTLMGVLLRQRYILKKININTMQGLPGNGNLTRMSELNDELAAKEKALLKSNAKFEAIFEHAPIIIGSFNAEGVPDLWNKEGTRIFGYSKDEIVGNPNALLLFYNKEDALNVMNDIKQASGKFIKYSPKTKAGRFIETMWANMPLPDGSIISVGYQVPKEIKKLVKNKGKSKATKKTHPSKKHNKKQ